MRKSKKMLNDIMTFYKVYDYSYFPKNKVLIIHKPIEVRTFVGIKFNLKKCKFNLKNIVVKVGW